MMWRDGLSAQVRFIETIARDYERLHEAKLKADAIARTLQADQVRLSQVRLKP
jgi:hypothetical protein